MALKRQQNLMAAFSMASMTDVIFLLLIFFMVTSTYVFPTALEVNLPQSSQQTKTKAAIRIYLDENLQLYTVKGDDDPEEMPEEYLETWLRLALEDEPDAFVALYADQNVPYGEVVKILDRGASMDIKIMLSTTPHAKPAELAAGYRQSLSDEPATQPLSQSN